MTDTAGGWLDERLDGDRRWTATEVGFDVEVEARAVLDGAEPISDEATPGVISGGGSWLAGHLVAEPVESVDEIVLESEEIEAAMASIDGIAVVDGAVPWSADDLDPGVVDADTAPDVETGGVVDPFDVFLATTEDESAATTIDTPTPDDDVPPPGTDDDGLEVTDLGPGVDDIAPAAESGLEAVAGESDRATTGGARDAEESGPESDAPATTEPTGVASSRLDAFDLPDALDTGDGPTPGPAEDDDPGDGVDDFFDGDVT